MKRVELNIRVCSFTQVKYCKCHLDVIISKLTILVWCFSPDFDIVTCQLPVSPKLNHGVNNDMCAIPEESGMDLLSIPARECAAQLTVMDAVSAIFSVSNRLCLTNNLFIPKGQLSRDTYSCCQCIFWNKCTLETKKS